MLKSCLSFTYKTTSTATTRRLRPGQQLHQFQTLLKAKSSPRDTTTNYQSRSYKSTRRRYSDNDCNDSSSFATSIMPKRKKSKFYAVAVGRQPGIYSTWDECQSQVKGHSNARFKSFSSVEEAESFIDSATKGKNSSASAAAAEIESYSQIALSMKQTAQTQTHKRPRVKVAAAKKPAGSSTPGSAKNPIRIESPSATAVAVKPKQGKPKKGKIIVPGSSRSSSTKTPIRIESPSASAVAVKPKKGKPKKGKITGDDTNDTVHKVVSRRAKGKIRAAKKHPRKLDFHVMFDGGSRGNPHGHAGSGTYILLRKVYASEVTPNSKSNDAKTEITRDTTNIRTYLGLGKLTNNQAEYTGLVTGLEQIQAALTKTIDSSENQNLEDVVVHIQGDSDLIVKQMNGIYACKSPKLKSFYQQCKELVKGIQTRCKTLGANCDVTFEHVYREHNTIADGLANEAMDAKRSWQTTKGDGDDSSDSDGDSDSDSDGDSGSDIDSDKSSDDSDGALEV